MLLLLRINVCDIFNMNDFFPIFDILQNTVILIDPEFWLSKNLQLIFPAKLKFQFSVLNKFVDFYEFLNFLSIFLQF